MDLAGRLAGYSISTRYSKLDATTVKEMKARIVDALGCAIGAFGEKPIKMARMAALDLRSGGPSSVIGTASRSSPDLATFVNGFMVRYFDYNDTYLSKEPAHPSDNLAPCLAVAQAEGSSGKELISAIVTAYEIQCRLCDAADIRHRGWDHVNYGLVSSSLAASKLMGLEVGEATQALNIALNGHIAMRQVRAGELTMWKGASFANAARNGVFAAYLAREGVTGPSPIFEGEMGFFKQVSGSFELDVGRFGGRGGDYKVKETYLKYWPAEYHAQSAVWAALDLRRELGGAVSPESVLVETHEAGYTILGKDPEKWKPKTKETADHSLPFIVASALLRGKVDNSTFESGLRDPEVLDLAAKVRVVEDPALTSMYPNRGMPNKITVTVPGGGKVSARVDIPKGHPANPMTKEDIDSKFLRLTQRYLGGDTARRVLSRLWSIEEERELEPVLGLLRVKSH